MKIAIIYASRHGSTQKVAAMIADGLAGSHEAILFPVEQWPAIHLEDFDGIILGTAIYAGRPSKKMYRYVTETAYKNILQKKRIGLFICGLETDLNKLEQEKEIAFPDYLKDRSVVFESAGGELNPEELSWFSKMIMKKVKGVTSSVSELSNEAIARIARAFI